VPARRCLRPLHISWVRPPWMLRGALRGGFPRLASAVALAFVLSVGCGTEEPPPLPLGGAEAPIDLEALPTLVLEEELRIGSLDDPDYGFSRISTVAVDRDDQVYVFEGHGQEIRVYSPEGQLLRRIGRAGEGPGEFIGGTRWGVMGDTVWAVDRARILLFDREGRPLSTRRYEEVRIPGHLEYQTFQLVPQAMEPGGTFIAMPSTSGVPAGREMVVVEPVLDLPRVRFSAEGMLLDTAGSYQSVRLRLLPEPLVIGRSQYWVQNPAPTEYSRVTPHGRLVFETPDPETGEFAELHLTWRDIADSVVRRRTYRFRPVRYTEAQLDESAAGQVRAGRATTAPPGAETLPRARPADSAAAHAAIREHMRSAGFSPWRPLIQTQHEGADGALWIARFDTYTTGDETRDWIVLDPEGEPRGRLELPATGFRVAWSRADTVWVIENDEFDVPWLVRFRLWRPDGPDRH
jgi:hypothetical protein